MPYLTLAQHLRALKSKRKLLAHMEEQKAPEHHVDYHNAMERLRQEINSYSAEIQRNKLSEGWLRDTFVLWPQSPILTAGQLKGSGPPVGCCSLCMDPGHKTVHGRYMPHKGAL